MRDAAILSLLVALHAACRAPEAGFATETLLEAGEKLGGCAIGDLDPSRPGAEVAVVAGSGRVRVLAWEDGVWRSEEAAAFDGEMIQCAAADLDASFPGDELVVVGMLSGGEDEGGPGVAHLIRRSADGWEAVELLRDEELLHGVCAGELDPASPGAEVVVAGYAGHALLVRRAGRADQEVSTLAEYEADAKCCAVFDGGAAIGLTDGTLLWAAADGRPTRVLDEAPSTQSRLGAHGDRLVVCRNDGVLALVGSGGREELFGESNRLRGAVLADVDPARPGVEAATAGYSGNVVVVYLDVAEPAHRVVYTDTDKLHHLAAGDLDGDGVTELVCCGYSGVVTLVRLEN